MASNQPKEYLFSVNKFNEPKKMEDKAAISTLLVRLILMEPGSNPLHPTMGVGLKHYRFGVDDTLEDLRMAIQEQIEQFLPEYQSATVALIKTPDNECNIEITIDDVVYVYDSKSAPVPITLPDIEAE